MENCCSTRTDRRTRPFFRRRQFSGPGHASGRRFSLLPHLPAKNLPQNSISRRFLPAVDTQKYSCIFLSAGKSPGPAAPQEVNFPFSCASPQKIPRKNILFRLAFACRNKEAFRKKRGRLLKYAHGSFSEKVGDAAPYLHKRRLCPRILRKFSRPRILPSPLPLRF